MKEKALDFFTALYEVAKVINSSLDPDFILKEIVKLTAKTMKTKAASIRLLDSRNKTLTLAAAYGLSKKYLSKGPVSTEESGIDKIALGGKSFWLKDAKTDEKFQYGDMAREEGITSVLVVPLTIEDRVMGVLRVYTEEMRKFTTQEIKFLEAVANLSALALDKAHSHQKLKLECDLMSAHKYRIDDN